MTDDNLYKPPESDVADSSSAELEYAGFWIRVGAALIDTIIMLLITGPLLTAIYGSSYWQSESFTNGAWDFLLSYVFPAVAVILFWIYKSATPGKMICGIKVISLGETAKLSAGQAVGRYLGYYVSMIPLLLGIIWVGFDKKKQGWHDKLANTAVVKANR